MTVFFALGIDHDGKKVYDDRSRCVLLAGAEPQPPSQNQKGSIVAKRTNYSFEKRQKDLAKKKKKEEKLKKKQERKAGGGDDAVEGEGVEGEESDDDGDDDDADSGDADDSDAPEA
jgi:hypothetical protein